MAKMSNRKKEQIAVSAIIEKANEVDSYLVCEIPVGDKAPTFDGHITVFKDDSESKESYLNDVPTQVKGTGVQSFTEGIRKFPLDLAHYQNFYQRGGCLLLVVEILENTTQTKIFYKQLLPTELKQIISGFSHQKTYGVELRPLEETNFYSVCFKFIEQMVRQPRILIENNQYKDEDYEKLIFTSMTFDPQRSDIKDIFNHDFIQFGVINNIEYPIRSGRLKNFSVRLNDSISIGKQSFNFSVKTTYIGSQIKKLVEDCVEFIFDETTNKVTFKINKVKSLAVQLKVLPMLIAFLKHGEIKFTDFYGEIKIDEVEEYLRDLEETLDLFEKLNKVFLALNVDENLAFGEKESVFDEIEQFVQLMHHHNYSNLKVKNPKAVSFLKYYIGDIFLILFYHPDQEKKLTNAFSTNIIETPTVMVFEEQNESARISPYIMLEKETLMHATNLNIDSMIRSFELMDYDKSEYLFNPINNFCLVCLNAFDETNNYELLKLPYFLLNKFEQLVSTREKNIIAINILQTKLRQHGQLTEEDYDKLIALKHDGADNFELQFCVNVLLKSIKEAQYFFAKFDKGKQEYYKTLPIYKLYISNKD